MIPGPDTRSGESTEPGFPTPAFSDPPLSPAAAVAGPRPDLAWSSPPAAATPLERFAAAVVDAAVVLAILAAATVLASVILSRGLHWVYRDESAHNALVGTNVLAIPALVLLPTLAAVAYCSVLPGMSGATLGMRVLHLEVCCDVPGGGRLGVRRGLIRFALFATGVACLFLGPASLLGDTRRRAWHDRVSGTIVARHPAPPRAAPAR